MLKLMQKEKACTIEYPLYNIINLFKSHTSRRFSVNINSCKLDNLEYESNKHEHIKINIHAK